MSEPTQPPADDRSKDEVAAGSSDQEEQSVEELLAEDKAAADSAGHSRQRAESVATLQVELKEAQDHVLRSQAELENFRKRVRREMEEERKFAALPLASDLLEVIDNLQRAIEAAENSQTGSGLLEGVKMVAAQMTSVLEKHHCKRIVADGVAFDPNLHQAIAQEPTNEVESGMVTKVAQAGYQLHQRVVRPSQVIVSVPLAESNQANESRDNVKAQSNPQNGP